LLTSQITYTFVKHTKLETFYVQAKRGFAAKAFFVMFLVKGAERRGQWINGAQKDLTLRWLWIY
jgi:hypothetical protein